MALASAAPGHFQTLVAVEERYESGIFPPGFQQAWIIIRVEKKCDEEFLVFVEQSVLRSARGHTAVGR